MSDMGQKDWGDKFTLIIPTHNRPHYLMRLLIFLSKNGCDFPVLISDSSSADCKERCLQIARRFEKILSIKVLNFPHEINPMQKWLSSLEQTKTEYTQFCADDDFIFPEHINKIVTFMDEHPDYVIGSGYVVSHKLFKDEHNNIQIEWGNSSVAGSLKDESPIVRMSEHLKTYADTIYGVTKREFFLDTFSETERILTGQGDRSYFQELLQSLLTVVGGKLYRVFEITSCRSANKGNPGWESQVTNREFSSLLEMTRECILDHLESETTFTRSEKTEIFNACFANYLVKSYAPYCLSSELETKCEEKLGLKIEQVQSPHFPDGLTMPVSERFLSETIIAHPAELEV